MTFAGSRAPLGGCRALVRGDFGEGGNPRLAFGNVSMQMVAGNAEPCESEPKARKQPREFSSFIAPLRWSKRVHTSTCGDAVTPPGPLALGSVRWSSDQQRCRRISAKNP
jgi:hypothetical protein